MRRFLLIASTMALPLSSAAQVLLTEDFQSGTIPATWTVTQTNA